MAEHVVYVRVSRATVRQALLTIPTIARSGNDAARAMMVRSGMALLGHIKRAFITKSRGGTDEAGESWNPLSPRTIAYSRRGGRTRSERKREAHPSQALNKRQHDRWWQVYYRQMGRFRGDKSKRGHAAAIAWAVVKSEGATTILEKYGSRPVEILRDTGLLLNSLSPGVYSSEQVFRTRPGTVIVGTNRRGAAAHHRGVPGRLPKRRLWPEPHKWPKSWWLDILEQIRQGIVDLTLQVLRGI